MKVGVHQGSVLSPLLFTIVLEALSREFRAGVPWEDLYADDLVIIADSIYPCAVCRTGVGNNSIYCNGCKL